MSDLDARLAAAEEDLRRLRAAVTTSPEGHLDEETLERLVAGELTEAQETYFKRHASLCAHCGDLLALAIELQGDLAAEALDRSTPPTTQRMAESSRRMPSALQGLAVAAAILLSFVAGVRLVSPEPAVVTDVVYRTLDPYAVLRSRALQISVPEGASHIALSLPATDREALHTIEFSRGSDLLYRLTDLQSVEGEVTVVVPIDILFPSFQLNFTSSRTPEAQGTVQVVLTERIDRP